VRLMGRYDGPCPPGPAADQQRKPLSDSGNILQPGARLADFEGVLIDGEAHREAQHLPTGLKTLVSGFG
jgi:hypothetical protein